jgi:hypothetical protein
MPNDPLKEIRSIRRQISKECHDDPDKVFDFYQQIQDEMKATGKYKFVNESMETANAGRATEQRVEPER